MKKNLKIASLFIIAIAFMFCFINSSNAEACDGIRCATGDKHGLITVHGNSDVYDVSSFNGTKKTYKIAPGLRAYKYAGVSRCVGGSCTGDAQFNVFYDMASALYCLDAHKDGNSTLSAWRFLGAGDQGSGVESYDQALLYILSQGNQAFVSNAEYFSKLIAIRAITATWGFFGNDGYNYTYRKDLWAVYGTTANFLSNSYTLTLYNQVNELLGKKGGHLNPVNTIRNSSAGYYFTGGTINTGHELYNGALQAAINYLQNSGTEVSVTGNYATETEKETTNDAGVAVEKNIVHTFKVKGFEKSGASIIVNQPTLDAEQKHTGVTAPMITSIKVNGKEIGPSAVGQNIIPLSGISFENEVTIEVTVNIKGQKSDEMGVGVETMKCGQQPIKYHLKIDYDAKVERTLSGKLGTIWYSGSQRSQRYVGIENRVLAEGESTTTGGKGSFENVPEVQLIPPCDCNDLEKACEKEAKETDSFDGPACQELNESNCGECSKLKIQCDIDKDSEACEEMYEYCDVTCYTQPLEFDCCDYTGDKPTLIVEGDNIPVNLNGPDNPYGCFVKGIDKQKKGTVSEDDPSYEAPGYSTAEGTKDDTEKNTYTLTKNKYCVISCKEDYAMSLPTAKQVNAGRYFTFKAQVTGTKSCYSNSIDIDQFNDDMERLVDDMERAVNQYIKYRFAIEYINSDDGMVPTYTHRISTGGCPGCGSTDPWLGVQRNISVPHFEISTEKSSNGLVTIKNINYISEKNAGNYKNEDGSTPYIYQFMKDYQVSSVDDVKDIVENGKTGDGIVDGGVDGTCTQCTLPPPGGGTSSTYATHGEPGKKDVVTKHLELYEEYWQKEYERLRELLEKLQQDFDNCSNDSWSSHLHYDPILYYNYEESYVEKYYNDDKDRILDSTKGEEETNRWYCGKDQLTGSYDKSNCKSNTEDRNTASINRLLCNLTDDQKIGSDMCKTDQKVLPAIQYVSESSTITANYKPKVLFYQIHDSAEILGVKQAEGRDDVTPVTDKEGTGGLPVSRNTERGIYKYTINFTNLGEFYDETCKKGDCKLGRLIGDKDNAVMNSESEEFGKFVEKETSVAVYSCSYLVNMKNTEGYVCDFRQECTDDCITDCIGPNCEEACKGVNCVADCVGLGCIYDVEAGSTFTERTVSLSVLFPNDTLSPNWNRDNTKADTTINEIEGKDMTVFEETPILSIKLSGSDARKIKAYNEANIPSSDAEGNTWDLDLETLGGYSNKTLDCYALSEYQEVACYSSFIDDVLDGKYGSIVNKNSLIANEKYRTHSDVTGAEGEYFEKWSGAVSEKEMIGPAWK